LRHGDGWCSFQHGSACAGDLLDGPARPTCQMPAGRPLRSEFRARAATEGPVPRWRSDRRHVLPSLADSGGATGDRRRPHGASGPRDFAGRSGPGCRRRRWSKAVTPTPGCDVRPPIHSPISFCFISDILIHGRSGGRRFIASIVLAIRCPVRLVGVIPAIGLCHQRRCVAKPKARLLWIADRPAACLRARYRGLTPLHARRVRHGGRRFAWGWRARRQHDHIR